MSTVLETERLCAAYGRQKVLHDLSLHVEEGQIYGFLGLNGAGKSTTIRLVLNLLKPSDGTVRLFGRNLKSGYREVLPRVGSLVEAPGFYSHLSGAENLRIGAVVRRLPESAVSEALELTGLSDAGGKPVGHYSMGMKQRLGLAWALLGRPRLLVLDEPINGLDPAGVREVRELLGRLSSEQGTTIFLSSHILTEVQQLADRIGVIHGGRLVAEVDSREELQAEVIVRIRCDQSSQAAEMAKRLEWVSHVAPGGDGCLEVSCARQRSSELNALLNRAGIGVAEFAWTRSSLEDFFLKTTGVTGEKAGQA